ncbi:DegV family protein [Amycolatopsis sp. H20-H5]|uniref:DegV family protein n=1 Tax=Amycolatopsis sp. H20-H5 TaxID=3046309 RepID=UPI002DBB0ACF|nr:DegV family protein [Amycolatopsis sp. H20-H5]MEC3973827.1 DegV family protein [Amycolatopsis sp. H20-H5]
MSPHIAVITDSTACLPEQLAAQWGISVVQVQLHVGDQTDDEHRFDRARLIELMRAGTPVTTSPPDSGAFFWAYQEAASSGASAIVSVHISGRMSETVQRAREAAQQVRIPVHVLDSGTTGMSLGFAAISAARVAAAGGQLGRVIDAAERRFRTSTELIYVDSLEWLRRGGRIGAAQAMLGTALSIKPLLTVRDGEVAPVARVAGTKRALAKLVELAVTTAGEGKVDVAVTRFGAEDREVEIGAALKRRLPHLADSMMVEASTIIGAHVGPGAVGITLSPAA